MVFHLQGSNMVIWIALGLWILVCLVGIWFLFKWIGSSEKILSNDLDKYFDEQNHERKEMGWKSEK